MLLEDVDIGEPGPGELRLDIAAIGLNRADALFRSGHYIEQPQFPSRLGYEASAVVDKLGEGVTGWRRGDKVSVIPGFSMSRYGVCAEQAIVPVSGVIPQPAALDAVEAAALWMAFLTAYGALIDIAGLGRGDSVVIPAASSSVGLAAIQIANSVGARPIALTRRAAKTSALLQAGASQVIVTEEQDVVSEVMRSTDGAGTRLVFDPVGGPGVEALLQATGRQGMLILYGNFSGQETPFPFLAAVLKGLSMRAYTVFEIIFDAPRFEAAKRFILDGLAAGRLRPTVAKTFALEAIVEAHRYLESNEQIGKIVVTV